MRKVASTAAQIALAVILVQLVSAWQAKDLVSSGKQAPNLAGLATLDSQTVAADKTGRKKLLYFFAPWCGVCKLHFSNADDFAGDNVDVYAIALSYENVEQVREFAKSKGANVPIILGNSEISRKYHIEAFPTMYFVDENNMIRSRTVGYTSSVGMWVRSLL